MKAERLSLDRMSNLPSNIIESILCLLPIKDAARTSILSRNWRYIWLTIPKLEFIEKDFEVTTNENQERRFNRMSEMKYMTNMHKMFYAIYQILLVHRGPIHEFALSMDADDTCFEIDQIILHLSRNYSTLKKFKLELEPRRVYEIPLSIFLLHQLTNLYLHQCTFDYDPTKVKGFGSLTSLYLYNVDINSKALIHLVSSCPLLKSFTLILPSTVVPDEMDNSTLWELLECLPMIEHLTISHWPTEYVNHDIVLRELPTLLVHLRYFCLEHVCFRNGFGIDFLVLVIRCSPNLVKLMLQIWPGNIYGDSEMESLDYSDIWLEHLKELEIEDFPNLKQEMEFVKVILAKSPMLKKVKIVLRNSVTKNEEVKMLRSLLHYPHTSPVVDFIVER